MIMNESTEESLSKMMTKLLRHAPEQFGVVLDPVDEVWLAEYVSPECCYVSQSEGGGRAE